MKRFFLIIMIIALITILNLYAEEIPFLRNLPKLKDEYIIPVYFLIFLIPFIYRKKRDKK